MPAHANGAYVIKPGDKVVTPSGRPASVQGIDRYGFRVCRYLDREGGEANIAPRLLTLVRAAPVRPWRDRRPFEGLDIDAGPRLTRRRSAG